MNISSDDAASLAGLMRKRLRDAVCSRLTTRELTTVADGIVWGVLAVDSTTRRHFGPDEVGFLSALANVPGLALYDQMALQRANEAVAKNARALDQEHFLLKERPYRSKNDLRLMLTMQERRQNEKQAKDGFSDVMDRFEVKLTPEKIPHERAVPLDLIVNEPATNSQRYAVPDGGSGMIRVGFSVVPHGEGRSQVSDDGIGMGAPRPGSSGTELIRRLVQQVGGQLDHDPVPRDTSFVIGFPMAG